MNLKQISFQLVLTILLGVALYFLLQPKQTYFVDNTMVIAHYVKAKGYDKELEAKQAEMQKDIESASVYLNSIQGSQVAIDTARAAKEMARVNQLRQQYQSHLQAEDQRISTQVREEVNVLIKKYTKEYNIEILFGATGNGNILHADETMDKTEELINFIDETAK